MRPGYARGDVDFPGASFDAWLTTEPADGCSLCTDPEELAKKEGVSIDPVSLTNEEVQP